MFQFLQPLRTTNSPWVQSPYLTYSLDMITLCKTRKWYKASFYNIIDIAIVNAFIFHQKICKAKGQVPFHPKAFRETLAVELSQVGSHRSTPEQPPEPRDVHQRSQHHGSAQMQEVPCKNTCQMCHL